MQTSLCFFKWQSLSKMTADKSTLPKHHKRRTFGRVSSAQPEHYSSHLAAATMSIPSSPSEIGSYPYRNFAPYRNQSTPEAGNGLCLIIVNNGSQKKPISWEYRKVLSNLEQRGLGLCFGQAGKNSEEGSWVTGRYLFLFLTNSIFLKSTEKLLSDTAENPSVCWIQKVDDKLNETL